jgi:hypothetical protein
MKKNIAIALAAALTGLVLVNCAGTDKSTDKPAETVGFYHQSTMPRR